MTYGAGRGLRFEDWKVMRGTWGTETQRMVDHGVRVGGPKFARCCPWRGFGGIKTGEYEEYGGGLGGVEDDAWGTMEGLGD